MEGPKIIVLMGVAGSGKTTVGQALSRKLRWPFFDADDFHPAINVAKMEAGIPLTDPDRWPWLESVRRKMQSHLEAGRSAVFACSALKQSYRDFLTGAGEGVTLVYLKGDARLIGERIAARQRHFMKAEMLASQIAALEEPAGCFSVDISASPESIADEIIRSLRLVPAA
jgi:gluconokinase